MTGLSNVLLHGRGVHRDSVPLNEGGERAHLEGHRRVFAAARHRCGHCGGGDGLGVTKSVARAFGRRRRWSALSRGRRRRGLRLGGGGATCGEQARKACRCGVRRKSVTPMHALDPRVGTAKPRMPVAARVCQSCARVASSFAAAARSKSRTSSLRSSSRARHRHSPKPRKP